MVVHGFVVLPPGHGKSYIHGRLAGVFEADTVVPCKSTPLLIQLRREAKVSRNWSAYDAEWTRLLNMALPDTPSVVLVPATSVGHAGGWTCLGGAVLQYHVWVENLKSRGDDVGWFLTSWQDTLHEYGLVFDTNSDLQVWLSKVSYEFLSNL